MVYGEFMLEISFKCLKSGGQMYYATQILQLHSVNFCPLSVSVCTYLLQIKIYYTKPNGKGM